jgi:hypothetical protein
VEVIVPGYRERGSGYQVGAVVRIVYETGSPVQGAEVTVEVAEPAGKVVVIRPTDHRGIAVVAFPDAEAGTYTFTVLDAARTGSVYDPAQNDETSDSVTIPSG